MAEKGPFLTSCIIFYLSIGAAIFQILEEPNWKSAREEFNLKKGEILKKHACLTEESLAEILEMASDAAGQGVTFAGQHRNSWDWANSVIFAATIVTTIGYGNVSPKTQGGRMFCILYGLCGIPLCLVWISELGSFFGDRAKRLSQVLIRKGVSVKKVQFTCTALFLLYGLLVHLLIPPFVFMSMEGWSYVEGLYFSFITLTTVGFGDFVAGVNPNMDYPRLYRVFAELWIYMGLAWLSLFFSWNVHMVVEAHKVLKKRRHRHRHLFNDEPQFDEEKPNLAGKPRPSVIDIFNFLSQKEENYSTVIKEIGAITRKPAHINRSKSCSDILATNIETLDHSPRHKRMISISEVFVNAEPDAGKDEQDLRPIIQESCQDPESAEWQRMDNDENKDSCPLDSESDGIIFTVSAKDDTQEESAQGAGGGGLRFVISKVDEDYLLMDKDEKG
ncbi:potassium channel subfamily K member 5 isoform X2 [Gasterosteus aculeatus]|uniref:Potassium channel domain-containing protein n=1 Tax=Gasterosteus aculeatus aculeatus TaxID=481459 RepID=A0AAQ4PHN4_GASAC|nr:potassium channel subfamily K member 5-like isoform X1 [Gasterosteus aculeatus aculeatus]